MSPRRPLRPRLRQLTRPLTRLARAQPVLPSLYDRFPLASRALRRPRGLQIVPIDDIVGTTRHPSQNTEDFLPLPGLRGRNWAGRWQRIQRAVDDLSLLPAVELMKVGDEYYVADGHNRVAAAKQAAAVAIDADVTELVMPGTTHTAGDHDDFTSDAQSILLGADELRQAAAGRQSRTAEHRPQVDELRREELTGQPETVKDAQPPAEPEG
jgi:hypothetical protein